MKADWDKLGDKYAKSDSVMIVDVDCTADGKQTCSKHGVKGYPTIQYFMAGKKKGQAYQGGRDLSSLSSFAKKTLETVAKKCNPATGADCKDIEKRFIDANKDKSAAELNALLATKKEENKATKKAKREYEKEHKTKLKEFKKQEKKFQMVSNLIQAMAKNAAKTAKTDL